MLSPSLSAGHVAGGQAGQVFCLVLLNFPSISEHQDLLKLGTTSQTVLFQIMLGVIDSIGNKAVKMDCFVGSVADRTITVLWEAEAKPVG